MLTSSGVLLLTAAIGTFMGADAFQNDCSNNIAMYWGQNSYGATNAADKDNWQKSLRYYCDDDSIDIIPVAFLTTFFSTGGLPSINLASTCNNVDNSTFPGTQLTDCSALADDIEYCQSKGKALTISLGGATGGVGFQSESQASSFADTIWDLFLGGSSETRPFGNAVLDGVDLDIEGGGSNYYTSFLKRLDSHFSSDSKKYYITAAPQCVYPDANLGNTINSYPFDAIYVQFYNNPCGLQTYGQPNNWNYGIWDYWARNISPNKDVKVYIGAPASSSAAGGGYVPGSTLQKIAEDTQKSFPSFGGVMFWDASQAYANGKIHVGVKSAISSNGCGKEFTYPVCSAPAWQSGQTYSAGQQVSYNGYIWTAKWSASEAPSADANGNWMPTSACKGGSGGSGSSSSSASTSSAPASNSNTPTSTKTTSKPTSVPSSTTTTTTASATATSSPGSGSGSCDGVSAWSASATYTQGSKVVYDNKLWVTSQWSYNDVPGGSSGVWKSQGACTAGSAAVAKADPSKGAEKRDIDSKKCEASLVQVWKRDKVYSANTRALYKGAVYRAMWFNTNAEPGESSVWEADEACTLRYLQRRKLQKLRR